MKIYRKRYVPNEIVDISGDEVLYRDSERLITKWKPINPREDIGGGISCTYLNQGFKISKFFNKDGSFKYWYCDIINYEYDESEDKYIITDLLLDVIVYQDGHYEVVDEDELEEALKDGIITLEIEKEAKEKLNNLLTLIENGEFSKIRLDEYEL